MGSLVGSLGGGLVGNLVGGFVRILSVTVGGVRGVLMGSNLNSGSSIFGILVVSSNLGVLGLVSLGACALMTISDWSPYVTVILSVPEINENLFHVW